VPKTLVLLLKEQGEAFVWLGRTVLEKRMEGGKGEPWELVSLSNAHA
jgi:hypothetical protein